MIRQFIATALLLVAMTAQADVTSSLGTGFDYTSGNYGGVTPTTILSIPVIGKIQSDAAYLKITVPYIRVSSTGVAVTPGVGPVKSKMNAKTTTTTTTESGLGDITTSAGYSVYDNDTLLLNLVGNIKFGTADASKNLGSGQNDYSVQVDADYTLDAASLLGTLGYKVVGAPEGVQMNNIFYVTAGYIRQVNNKTSVGLMFDAAQGSSELSNGTRELSLLLTQKVSKKYRVQAHFLKGFSSSSPDFGFGLLVTAKF